MNSRAGRSAFPGLFKEARRGRLRDVADLDAPPGKRVGKLPGERRGEPTHPLPGLVEVGQGERSGRRELEQVAVDERTNRLHHVRRQRVSVELVGVEHAEPGVEPDDARRDRRLRIEQRIEVVEERVRRVRRRLRRAGNSDPCTSSLDGATPKGPLLEGQPRQGAGGGSLRVASNTAVPSASS